MDRNRKEKYENAVTAVKAHRIREAFELYVSLFLPKGMRSREFLAFYRFQMASYLSLKKSVLLSIAEGDMVSDLIETVYEETVKAIDESQIPVSPAGRMNILESVEIIFPCQKDTEVRRHRRCVAE